MSLKVIGGGVSKTFDNVMAFDSDIITIDQSAEMPYITRQISFDNIDIKVT